MPAGRQVAATRQSFQRNDTIETYSHPTDSARASQFASLPLEAILMSKVKNQEIADIFAGIADLLEILASDRFRINSYRRVSRTISDLPEAVEDVAAASRLGDIPGVGKSTAEKIIQYLETGSVSVHRELLGKVPPDLPALLKVEGLGPKTVAKLWKQAGIDSVDELKRILRENPDRLTGIEGMGKKKADHLRQSLEFMDASSGRIRLGQADAMAQSLIESLEQSRLVRRTAVAGSLRRGAETIGDIDLLCQGPRSRAAEIIKAFTTAPSVRRVLASGKTKGSVILADNIQADLRVVPKASFASALMYFTGSRAHNIRLRELAVKAGDKLNEYGLFRHGKPIDRRDEKEIYNALGMQFVPPELREDRGEISAAMARSLPKLVELSDIRGDLHMHTTYSDGRGTIEEMIDACRARGYKYMVISDHSKSQVQANGLDASRLIRQAESIRSAAARYDDIMVLAGVEVDIFKDGSLDFDAEVLGELDFVTASAHSALSQRRPDATRRLIRAIEHPHVHCIGHPSGRLINSRAGMELNIREIAAAAAANNVALEVNAHYWRLDLRDTHIRVAIEAGAKIAISTDAHNIDGLDIMEYGVTTARRGWATCEDVINTLTPKKLTKWIKGRR